MNKYQEALDCVTGITRKMLDNPTVEFSKKYLESIKLLEELVDKATPVKPDDYKNLGFVLCGTYVIKMKTGKCKCGHPVDLLRSHCPCGQALDWTDDATSE